MPKSAGTSILKTSFGSPLFTRVVFEPDIINIILRRNCLHSNRQRGLFIDPEPYLSIVIAIWRLRLWLKQQFIEFTELDSGSSRKRYIKIISELIGVGKPIIGRYRLARSKALSGLLASVNCRYSTFFILIINSHQIDAVEKILFPVIRHRLIILLQRVKFMRSFEPFSLFIVIKFSGPQRFRFEHRLLE